jgi:hypothetical protein
VTADQPQEGRSWRDVMPASRRYENRTVLHAATKIRRTLAVEMLIP